MNTYRKYTYWIPAHRLEEVQAELKAGGRRLRWARGVVCSPLDPVSSAMIVPPSVWEENCDRQGSWYRTAPRAGWFLLVSPQPVAVSGCEPNTVISPSDFRPDRPATAGEIKRLLASPAYRRRVPEQWSVLDDRERKRWAKLLTRAKVGLGLDEVLEIHSANHANFLEPLLALEENGRIIPYSVERSDRLCSCCLELYNVVGDRFPEKLVSPCLGALYFARMERDRFYRVVSLDRGEPADLQGA